MGDSRDGWHTVMPTSQAGIERLSKPQLESYERQILREWESSRGSWSGVGKHTSAFDFAEAKKLHPRFKPAGGQVLGRGTYGVVEKVNYAHNSRSVCLARKWIQYRRGRTIQMLREEADVMEKLDHDHIVKLVGTYSIRTNELFLLIWPVAPCNLESLINDIESLRAGQGDRADIIERLAALEFNDFSAVERKRESAAPVVGREGCPLKYLQQIMGCITEAVRYCHHENIRHLDLKPSNILLTPGKVYLADFGIARDVNDRDHTMTFGLQGTPKWRAPEICNPKDEWSMKSADVYSLGLVLLNIATIVYGADLADFDDILNELIPHTRAEKIRQYHIRLQLLALATQHFADHNAHTFAPKHVVNLTSQMLSQDPARRPTADHVDTCLVELGGLDQIYHSPCCRKSSRTVTCLLDTRYKLAANKSVQLRLENEKIARRLQELEGRDETYQMRLENERRQHAKNMINLQKQLEDEQKERKRLEFLVADLQGGRRQRQGLPRPEMSISGGRNGVLMMPSRPQTHQPPPQTQIHVQQRPPTNPSVSFIAKTQIRPISATVVRPDLAVRGPADSPRPNGTPSPGIDGFPLRSRGSGSRLPVAVNPSTPIRSRSGTPGLARDPSLTDSTQFSMASSTFSHLSKASKDSESAANSPALNGSPVVAKAGLAAGASDKPALGLGIVGGVVDMAKHMDTASVVSSNAAPGTASPMLSASALSSPRMARLEVESTGSAGARVPALPTAKSWADVARRERR